MASLNLPAVAGRVSPSNSTELEPFVPIILPTADPIAEQIQVHTNDPICRAIALECDRLDVILQHIANRKTLRTTEATTTIARRMTALKLLGERMDRLNEKEQVTLEVSVMAKVVRLTKDVLRESGLPAETRETLFQSLVEKISVTREEGQQ